MRQKYTLSTLAVALTLLFLNCLPQQAQAQYSFWGISSEAKIAENLGGFSQSLDNSDFFGKSVANIGDVNGDGQADIAIAAEGDDDGGTNKGAVYICFLDPTGLVMSHTKISATSGNFTGPLNSNNNNFGRSVCGLGDINGDGIPDIAVGDDTDDDGGSSRGAVYILFLNTNGTVLGEQKLSDTQGNFLGVLDNSDNFGRGVSLIGDIDGDGNQEIAVGSNHDGDGGSGRGAVYVISIDNNGKANWHQKISDTQGTFTATLDNDDRFGSEVAGIGDLNGDNVPDIAVTANKDDDGGSNRGAVYIIFLKSNGYCGSFSKISDTQGNFFGVLDDNDNFGMGLAAMPDFECDGTRDIAIGAWRDDDAGSDRGAVYMVNLTTSGQAAGYWKITEGQSGFVGPLSNIDRFGMSIAYMGDLNSDKVADIAVGARHDDHGGTDKGAVWMLNGQGWPCERRKAEVETFVIEEPVEVRVYDLTGRKLWSGDFVNQLSIEYPSVLPREQILIYQYWTADGLQRGGKMILE